MPKRAKIGLMGERWSTVIGPPSVLRTFFTDCPAVKALPKDELNIHALQHAIDLSEADLDFIVGDSPLMSKPIFDNFRLFGMDDPEAKYENWGQLMRKMTLSALSIPLDTVEIVQRLKRHLGKIPQVVIKNMGLTGPTSHASSLVNVLETSGTKVIFENSGKEPEKDSIKPNRIAIVGMAGQGPGAENVEELWKVIVEAQDTHKEMPKDRFDLEEYMEAGKVTNCKSTIMAKHGCFIDKVGYFDARFFNISPREALLMEPGHRLFLMSAYEALETAGYSNGITRATDSERISIFYGQCNDDWRTHTHDVRGCDSYTLTGTARAFGPGRLAYHFGWEGPTYVMDSACSSSCSAINLACTSLLSKDVDMAVAGAANVIAYPHTCKYNPLESQALGAELLSGGILE